MGDLIKAVLMQADRREEVGKTQPLCPKCQAIDKQVQLLYCYTHIDVTGWKCRNLACRHYFELNIPRSSATTKKTSSEPDPA